MLTKLLIWIDMKTKWSFIAVALTALLSACSPVKEPDTDWRKEPFVDVQKAAEQGYAKAQHILGVKYIQGEGVPQDYKQAAHWYKKAAEQGHAEAQFKLGLMYAPGLGVPQDYKQAVHWHTKAAEQGVAEAQLELGFMYSKGYGVPQDYSQAYAWLSVAVANGYTFASGDRDKMAKKLTPAELSKAQKLATQYFEKYQPK